MFAEIGSKSTLQIEIYFKGKSKFVLKENLNMLKIENLLGNQIEIRFEDKSNFRRQIEICFRSKLT